MSTAADWLLLGQKFNNQGRFDKDSLVNWYKKTERLVGLLASVQFNVPCLQSSWSLLDTQLCSDSLSLNFLSPPSLSLCKEVNKSKAKDKARNKREFVKATNKKNKNKESIYSLCFCILYFLCLHFSALNFESCTRLHFIFRFWFLTLSFVRTWDLSGSGFIWFGSFFLVFCSCTWACDCRYWLVNRAELWGRRKIMSLKSRGELTSRSVISQKWAFLLCIGCFCAGMLFTNRYGYEFLMSILKVYCLWVWSIGFRLLFFYQFLDLLIVQRFYNYLLRSIF